MRWTILALPVLLAAGPAAPWRERLPLTVAPGMVVQRVELPARAILALQRADGGDVRVLDAAGRAQPMARLPTPVAEPRRLALTPLPIRGAADALKVTGVSLKVDGDEARVVQVDGAPGGAGEALLGVLLDTRGVDAPARALTLDVAAPGNQPVTFAVESSGDLRRWTTAGERVLFGAGGRTSVTVPLADADLRGRMLRVTWRGEGRLLTPVAVAGASLLVPGSIDAARVGVRAKLPALIDRHVAAFAMPLAVGPAAIRVQVAGDDLPTPVVLEGRTDREAAWTEVGRGVAGKAGSRVEPIELDRAYREWRIVAAASGDGFSGPPSVELRMAPVAVAFLPAGKPPFSLVAGRADAGPSELPLATLERMATGGAGPMPRATVVAGPAGTIALPALEAGASAWTWLLWGVLLMGVAALAAMAWALGRPKARERV